MDRRYRLARVAVSTAFFVQGLCFAALLTKIPALKDRFDFTDGELSLVLLAVPVVSGVGSVLAGALASRYGSAVVLRVGAPGVALAIITPGAADSRPMLMLSLVAVGLGLGVVDAAMNMQGVAVERRYGRPLLASFHATWSVGGIVGALSDVGAAALDWPLVAALASVGTVGSVLALVAGRSFVPRADERAGEVAAAEAAVGVTARLPWRPIILVGTAMMLVFVADSATSNWSAVYLDDVLAAGAGATGLGLAAYQACMLLGRVVTDRLVGRHGPTVVVAVGALVGVAGLVGVAAAPRPWVAIVGFAVLGAGFSVVVPQSFSAAGRLDPAGTGVAIARVNLFNYVGFILGAALIGVVAETANLRLAFAVTAVLALGVAVLAPAFRVRAPTAAPPNAPVLATAEE